MCRGVLGPAHPAGEVTEHQLMLEAIGGETNGEETAMGTPA
jgi:hypothetical protein